MTRARSAHVRSSRAKCAALCAKPSGGAGRGQLVLGVADALLDLPPVRLGLATLDLLQLRLRLLKLAPRALDVDLVREHRVVHERDRTVLLHLEEPWTGRELAHAVVALAEVDARRTGLQRRDQRRMPREDADLPGRARDDQHHRLAFERRPVRGDERDRERLVRHYAATGSGSGSGSRASSPASVRPLSTALSIVPTM